VEATSRRTRLGRLALAGLAWAEVLLVAGVLVHLLAGWKRPVHLARGRLPAAPEVRASTHVDRHLSFVASVVARLGVEVRCWSTADWRRHASVARPWPPEVGELGPWQGFSTGRPLEIELGPGTCSALARLMREHDPIWRDGWSDAIAWSVAGLASQAVQMRFGVGMATAYCDALQSVRMTAVRIGATPEEGRYLAIVFWKHWYPWLPAEFRSSECRNGGALDLHPGANAWP
jgi:hypothetical protein